MYTLLSMKNNGLRDAVLDFARELIRTPSPTLRESEVARRIEARLREVGFDQVVTDECGNVTGILFGRQDGPTVLLNSHMDTVDAGDSAAWVVPPLKGEVKDGVLHGLGASDCKAALAAQIYSALLLKRSLLPLQGNLVFSATVCEEQGGSPGLRHLVKATLPSLDIRPDFAILGDPTGLCLYHAHDGSVLFEVTIEGGDGFQVNDATQAVFDQFQVQDRLSGCSGGPERQRLRSPRFERVPGRVRGVIDLCRRLPETENVTGVMEQIRHEARMAADPVARVAVGVAVPSHERRHYTQRTTVFEHRVEPWCLDPYHPLIMRGRQALAAAGCAVSCGRWRLPRLGMGTAGGVLFKEYGIPAIGFGPGSEDTCHGPNESVAVEAISQAVYGTAAIVHSLIGVPVCGWTLDEI